MASISRAGRILQENVIFFGIRWSLLGAMLAVLMLSGCSAFNTEIPRYNTVIGEKRIPQLNPGGQASMEEPVQQAEQQDSSAPVAKEGPVDYYAMYHGEEEAAQEEAPQVYTETQTRQLATMSMEQYAPAPYYPGYQQQPLPDNYPQLPASMQQQWQTTPGNMSQLQSEISALEAELAQSQQQQQQVAAEAVPNYGQEAYAQQPYAPQYASQPMTAAAPPPPPPPAAPSQDYVNNGTNAYGNFAQQPAPAIDYATAPAPAFAPQPQTQPAPVAPAYSSVPAALTPPEPNAMAYQQHPLPPFNLPPPPGTDSLMAPSMAAAPAPMAPDMAAYQPRRVPSQQPNMADPMAAPMPMAGNAPVIDDQMAQSHYASMPMETNAAPAAPVDVPLMPDVKTAQLGVPGGLVPPSMAEELGGAYLPASRYANRR